MSLTTTPRPRRWPEGTALATRGVLAGAYKGRIDDERRMVTHAVVVDEKGWEVGEKTLCRRIAVERLSDDNCGVDKLGAPTCPECLKRAAR